MRTRYLTVSFLIHSLSVLRFATPGLCDWHQTSTPSIHDINFIVENRVFTTHVVFYGSNFLTERTPLIVLHGGPGLSHNYMLPISDLSLTYSTPIIFYDQIGNGLSSHWPDAPSSFWTKDLFMDQLQSVIDYWGMQSDFALLGHAWGSTLALEYTSRRTPTGLKGLVLSDGLATMESYLTSTAELLRFFPPSVQQGLSEGFSNPAAFEAAFKAFYAVHGLRVTPTPPQEAQTLAYVFGVNGTGGDPTVAKVTSLTPPDWSIVDDLPYINAKTLVINGRYSVAQDFVIAPLVCRMPNAVWARDQFQQSSQMPWWEEPAYYQNAIGRFLMGLY